MLNFCKTLAFLIFSFQSLSATYYVTTSGNNINDGSIGSPWLTVQKGFDIAVGGDTVNVGAGTYAEVADSVRAGTAGNYITILGASGSVIYGFEVRHDYVEIRGFEINGVTTTYALWVKETADNARIIGNTFTNTPGRALQFAWTLPPPTNGWVENNRFFGGTDVCVGIAGAFHVFTNNWMTMRTNTDPEGDCLIISGSNIQIVNNVITNWSRSTNSIAHIDIIQAFTSAADGTKITNVVFEGNLVINCVGTQIGMLEDQEKLGNIGWWTFRNNIYVGVEGVFNIYIHTVLFANNVYYRSGLNSGSPLLPRVSSTKGNGHNITVKNCIFFECGSSASNPAIGWYGPEVGTTNFVGNHNLVIGTGAGTTKTGFTAGGLEANGINGVDPLFTSGDPTLPLQSASPCIGAGENLSSLFTTAYNRVTRTPPWDIGAYESDRVIGARVKTLRIK